MCSVKGLLRLVLTNVGNVKAVDSQHSRLPFASSVDLRHQELLQLCRGDASEQEVILLTVLFLGGPWLLTRLIWVVEARVALLLERGRGCDERPSYRQRRQLLICK